MRLAGLVNDPTGRTIAETFPNHHIIYQNMLDEVYRTGQPLHRVDEPHQRSETETTHYLTYTFTPLFAHENEVDGVLLMAEDTTDEVQAQLALDAERARLRAIIDNSPVGILVADHDSR
jgi:PAS domain-containing protein